MLAAGLLAATPEVRAQAQVGSPLAAGVAHVSDGTATLSSASFGITVSAVNDAPAVTNHGLTVNEDTSITLTTSMLTATDADNTDNVKRGA